MSIVRVFIVLGVVLLTGCSSTTPATPTPEYDLIELVEDFHVALLEWDLKDALSYFHEDAVLSLDWSNEDGQVEHLDVDTPGAIQARIRGIVVGMTEVSIYEAEANGNMVTFTTDSIYSDGTRFLNDGYAEFKDGKIVHLYWDLTAEPVE